MNFSMKSHIKVTRWRGQYKLDHNWQTAITRLCPIVGLYMCIK